jgi:hypothetical protein
MGSKSQRQNQHQRRLRSKIKRFEKKGWSVAGLKKELSFCTGETDRPGFSTGSVADARNKRSSRSITND